MDSRIALRLNAALSFATGALLTIAPATVGTWLGVDVDGWLRLLGVGLIAHGGALVWAAAQPHTARWTALNVALIAPYPLIMVGLVVTGLIPRDIGKALALTDGVLVGLLAVAQFNGLRNMTTGAHPQHA